MRKAIIIGVICCLLGLLSACQIKGESDTYEAGLAALDKKEYTAALAQFQSAAKEDGYKAEAYRMEGIVYLKMQEYDFAVTLLNKSLEELKFKHEDFEKDVNYYLGEAHKGSGNTEKAIEIYSGLISKYKDAEAYFLRGQLYLEQQEEEKATSDFKASLKKDTGYENYMNVYMAYAAKNRGADGAAYLEKALHKDSEKPEEQYQQGRIYYYLEEYDSAKKVLNKAVNSKNQDAVLLLGRIYLETGDTVNARALYQNYLRDNGKSAIAYNGLALCDIADREHDSALENIQKGLKYGSKEEQESLLFNEIIAYERQLDFETAKEKMTAFLEKYPDNEAAIRENTFLQKR